MILLRNAVFYTYLGIVSCLLMASSVVVRLRRGDAWPLISWYLRALLWGLSNIVGLKHQFKGTEKLSGGAVLIACSQQSTWENFAFPLLFSNPLVFVKTGLRSFPVAGWIARQNGYVWAARHGDLTTTKQGFEEARRQFEAGRPVLIFPEGTRNTVPGDARIKAGIAALYQMLKVPCTPVVLNSGDYWPYGHHLIRPGTITIEVLDPIPAGLSRQDFMDALKTALDEGSLRLSRAPSRSGARAIQ